MMIVLAEERAKGWTPRALNSREQVTHGCDIVSEPPGDGATHFIEVKAWGRPFLTKTGRWSWPDVVVRESQLAAVKRNPTGVFRFEIVANLDAHRRQGAPYERLTLLADDVAGNETSRVVHAIRLPDALKSRIRPGDQHARARPWGCR